MAILPNNISKNTTLSNRRSNNEEYNLNNDFEERRNYQRRQVEHRYRLINNNLRQVYSTERQSLNRSAEIIERRPKVHKRLSIHYGRDLNQMITKDGKISQKKLYSNIRSNLPEVTEERVDMVMNKVQFLIYLNKKYSSTN